MSSTQGLPPGCGPEHSSVLVSKENTQKTVQALVQAAWRGAEGRQSKKEKEEDEQSLEWYGNLEDRLPSVMGTGEGGTCARMLQG